MLPLQLHHFGLLTTNTKAWLAENELLIGKPHHISETVYLDSQKVFVTFVEQTTGAVLIELVEPLPENKNLQGMIAKGISLYHTAHTVAKAAFNDTIKIFENEGAHALPVFRSAILQNRRCVFLLTRSLGMIELIEE